METVRERVKDLLNIGQTKEKIYSILIEEGNPVDLIAGVFHEIETEQAKEPQAPVAQSERAPKEEAQVVITEDSPGDKEDDEHKGRAISVLLTIGAILIAAGIFSFIASNWQHMTDMMKIVLIIFGIVVFNVSGWHVKHKTPYTKTGEALLLLGALTYGAGIFLVAQIFNIRADWPDGFMIWAIGVLPFAFILESGALYTLAIIVGAIGVVGYPSVALWDIFDRNPSFNTTQLTDFILYVTTIVVVWFGVILLKKNPPTDRDYY